MSDIQGDSWKTSTAVEFCGNFLHVTDRVLKIVWMGKIQSLLFCVAFWWYIYNRIFFYN